MKKLSLEEKAKAYDEIIFLIEKQNEIIPEDAILDSNEDGLIADTIRHKKQTEQKPILDFNADDWYTSKVDSKIHNATWCDETPSCVQIKKQGERVEPVEGFDTEFEKQISHLIASVINKDYEYTKAFVKWTSNALLNYAKYEIEKQGEQILANSAKTCKDEQKLTENKDYSAPFDIEIPFGAKDSELIRETIRIPDGCYASIEGNEIVIKKGEKHTNETLYLETLDKAIDLYYYSYGNGNGGFDNLSLEKFRDIVYTFIDDYGQKSAEWGEEDEQYLLVCKNALTKYQTTDKWDANIIFHWLENKLKSFISQNKWKPTDLQIEALESATENCAYSEYQDCLRDLIKQLKQLS